MQTFIARFVRPNGDHGVLHVLAVSAGFAVQDVLNRQGPVARVNVKPERCAALLASQPWLPGRAPAEKKA